MPKLNNTMTWHILTFSKDTQVFRVWAEKQKVLNTFYNINLRVLLQWKLFYNKVLYYSSDLKTVLVLHH